MGDENTKTKQPLSDYLLNLKQYKQIKNYNFEIEKKIGFKHVWSYFASTYCMEIEEIIYMQFQLHDFVNESCDLFKTLNDKHE